MKKLSVILLAICLIFNVYGQEKATFTNSKDEKIIKMDSKKISEQIEKMASMVKGNPLYKEAQEVFESLAVENHDLALENIRINKKTDNDRIIFVGAPNKEVPAETWRMIAKALNENRIINSIRWIK